MPWGLMDCVLEASGLCQAALHALGKQDIDVRRAVLWMLYSFLGALDEHRQRPAMAVLVGGDVVELTLGHLADAGRDDVSGGVAFLCVYLNDPGARERMCTPGSVNQLINWIAKWLLEVREVAPRSGKKRQKRRWVASVGKGRGC
jgi:hypothetical protein